MGENLIVDLYYKIKIMKTSCLSVSLFPLILNGQMSILEYIRFLKSLGLDGFDLGAILLKNRSEEDIKKLSEEIQKEQFAMIMLTTAPDFTHPDAIQREKEFELLAKYIKTASVLKAKYVRIVAGQAHPGVSRKEGINWVVEYFKKSVSIAEKNDIILVYEDHSKTAAWEHLDFSNPPDIFLEIAEKIKDTPIKINFDTANILVAGEDKTLEVLEKVFSRVETIHVNDISTKGTMSPTLIGTGIVPIKEVFAFLKSRNFNGWLCIEEWGNQGMEGVRKAVEYTKKTWLEA